MVDLKARFTNCGVYTGRGFVTSYASQMANWLPSFPCWMSQYVYQPKPGTVMSWANLKAAWLPKYDPNMEGMGALWLVGHQFTGDCVIPPGSYQFYTPTYKKGIPLDVSIFKKSYLKTLSDVGNSPVTAQPVVNAPAPAPITPGPAPLPALFKAVVKTGAINVRNAVNGTIMFSEPQGTVLNVFGLSGDWGRIDPTAQLWVFMSNVTRVP